MIKKEKDAKEKKGRKNDSSFHYFEQNDQYRIERSPVITGDLKIICTGGPLGMRFLLMQLFKRFLQHSTYRHPSPNAFFVAAKKPR